MLKQQLLRQTSHRRLRAKYTSRTNLPVYDKRDFVLRRPCGAGLLLKVKGGQMRGFTFTRQTKLHDVCGRIHYISSHEEQEHLYAPYETNPAPFWDDLARECQTEFKRSGAHGRCIEARELIIALPKSLQQFNPSELLKHFTEEFKKEYGVECSSALHHNPRKTNYHIHLIYSERTLLDNPAKKTAGRNLFFNAAGKRVRTKTEILDEDGGLLPGCRIVPKGEVYEQRMFSEKDDYFKSKTFVRDVKHHYTEIMNRLSMPNEKLKVFNPDSPYLATKKIGKHNPHEKEIREDNRARDEWNRQVNVNLKYGMPEESMKIMKQTEIIEPLKESIAAPESGRSAFRQIVLRAAATARNCIRQFYPANQQEKKSMLDSLKEFIALCRAPERTRTIEERKGQER